MPIMNRVLPTTRSTPRSRSILMAALACSLTLSACASPVAPAANPTNFYDAVRDDVTGFWASYFSAHGGTYTPITGMHLFTGQTSSGCGGSGGTPAFYCSADQGVYLDSAFIQSQLTKFGKFGPAVIIAHEMGHHTQDLLGLLRQISIAKELQADCLAGTWFNSANARGLLEAGDFQQAAKNLFEVGDPVGYPWFAPDAHGTSQLRLQAFDNGFLFGANSC